MVGGAEIGKEVRGRNEKELIESFSWILKIFPTYVKTIFSEFKKSKFINKLALITTNPKVLQKNCKNCKQT